MKKITLFLLTFLLGTLLFSCTAKSLSPEKSATSESSMPATRLSPEESWGMEWNNIVTQAGKEGKVIIATMIEPLAQRTLGKVMKEKYNIEIEWRAGLSSETAARVLMERRAGIYNLDVWTGGANTMVSLMKPAGAYDPLIPALILPEIKIEAAWWEGKLPYIDEDKLMLSFAAYAQKPIGINTELARKEELTSAYDLLNPRWKEKIMMGDPTIGGSASKWFGVMVEKEHGPILGLDYMKKLVAQKPVIIRDRRLGTEWLVRGKYPIGLGMQFSTIIREMEISGISVPFTEIIFKEGGYITSGYSILALMNKAPHPSATRVFINWLLSREGQIIYSKAVGFQSTRIDIPEPDEINKSMEKREPGVKYINSEKEQYLLKTSEYVALAREIFAPLLR